MKIRTRLSHSKPNSGFYMAGWYQGKHTYLWFGNEKECLGFIEKKKLHRLAKAIVKQFEGNNGK